MVGEGHPETLGAHCHRDGAGSTGGPGYTEETRWSRTDVTGGKPGLLHRNPEGLET